MRVGERESAAEDIAMTFFSEPLFYYLMLFVADILLFDIAITGTLSSGRMGMFRPMVSVKSLPLRIAFFFISVAIFAFLIWMTRHQIAAGNQYFGFIVGGGQSS
jgi:hypothetical protein